MPLSTAFAIYFLIWWVTLFTVLPWGVHSQHENGVLTPGTDPGAPTIPNLGRKLIWTTIIAGIIFASFYFVYVNHLVTLNGLVAPFGVH